MESATALGLKYKFVRLATTQICVPLQTEDYVVQPIPDVSPPKWHLGHTSWFFETFVLVPFMSGYKVYNKNYNYVFNSYYETIGSRVIRTDRGNLSRPTVDDVYEYRQYVDDAMIVLLNSTSDLFSLEKLVVLGINHEQQHQELLWTDIKYILGHNPLFPAYSEIYSVLSSQLSRRCDFINIEEGLYTVGFAGTGFSWDNEHGRHKVYLNSYQVSTKLVTNGEYLEFMTNNGYGDFRFWHSQGWAWVNEHNRRSPLFWHMLDGTWFNYTMGGFEVVDPDMPVCHVSYYEAYAYAAWKGLRLPTEFEWEVAAPLLNWGERWEWTSSSYLPYPGFEQAPGALGEYNGKFMVNQQVLRGSSEFTSEGHSRITYRNFFEASAQWQFSGIRLVK